MDLKKDREFLYIAKEGLQEPIPPDWKPYRNRQG